MKAIVHVQPRKGVLDPQGQAVAGALQHLGFSEVQNVRQGKVIELEISGTREDEVRARVVKMCEQLLANTVIEDYQVSIEP
jgi:phosphoribosylformylglycinamidine synthase subunit PurS